MKKIVICLVAFITSAVSLALMYLFDILLSFIYFYIDKVKFLATILDFIGGILDLGLTALVAIAIAVSVWEVGHKIVEKIIGIPISRNKSPIYNMNYIFTVIFVVVFIFIGYKFIVTIGPVASSYMSAFNGVGKGLALWEAIKETFWYVRDSHIFIYRLGTNSFILAIINMYYSGEM